MPAAKVRVRRRRSLVLIAGAAALIGTAVWAVLDRPSALPPPVAGVGESEAPLYADMMEDYGIVTRAWHEQFLSRIKDPSSLEDIRDNYPGVGYRGIRALEEKVGRGDLPPGWVLSGRVCVAKLYLYEGDFARAATTLAEVRAAAEADPDHLRDWIPPLAYLQGVTALRRGETDNCVACPCASSCIVPLQPQAFHRQRQGSADAVRYFTEYLHFCPDDLGGRWLLNLAYMTLGEYPQRVPPRYRIPPEAFRSQGDIGRFRNVAPALGLDRLEQAGGAIMDDFDNDGLLDVLVTSWDPQVPIGFYKNRGDGTFEERARAAGLAGQLGGLYCVQTDYNNDGWLDVYVCRGAWWNRPIRHSLLRNNRDGTFTDVTREAGLAAPMDSQVAAWADFDLDGRLDLFVGGETAPSRLYRNRGDGTFEDVTARSGITTAERLRRCKGAAWGDFDGDGYPDLFISDRDGRPSLCHNNHDGTFTDVGASVGIIRPRGSFACWVWDYDNDGWPDIFVATGLWDQARLHETVQSYLRQGNTGETYRLFRNRGDGTFEDVTRAVGLELAVPTMGCNFADLDNDGFLDMYLGTGGAPYSLLIPKLLLRNVQGQKFVDVTTSSGTGHLQKGHSVAIGDWDRDGNLDIFLHLGGAYPGDTSRNVLFQNPGAHGNHWICVKLVGTRSNRPGIGSRIKVVPAGEGAHPVYRWVTSGSSFGANPLEQHIGIGKPDRIAALEVYWPASRTTQVFRDLEADQSVEITEGQPTLRRLDRPRVPAPN
jgi:hypothetical protein